MFADLLSTPRSPQSVVAFDEQDKAIEWQQFLGEIARLTTVLSHSSDRPAGRWLLFTEDSYAFAVALMALAQTGSVAVLPPNGKEGTLRESSDGCVGLLSDQKDLCAGIPALHPLEPPVTKIADESSIAPIASSWKALDREAPLLELFTSGTTGKRKVVSKLVRHLDDELATLEETFGDGVGPSQVFATASHQHLYGLLFRLLWPLCSGRPFYATSFLHPEELFSRMAAAGDSVLVATPAHLKRMRNLDGLARIKTSCRTIFSSGGPLAEDTAQGLAEILGRAPFEIFGSTETGGVAWRQQTSPQASDQGHLAWTPLPSVQITRNPENACLGVSSPFVSEASESFATGFARGFEMGDCVEMLSDGRFVLKGRADRIVKIGEKRLSLPEMETRLSEQALIREVALLPLEQAGEVRVAAAVVLSNAGQAALNETGRRGLGQTLAKSLETYWDRVLLPRVWRYVDKLPEDAQGKVTQSGLLELFQGAAPEATSGGSEGDLDEPASPLILEDALQGDVRTLRCQVPANLRYFDGHFPGYPVVAGVVQLDWIMEAAGPLLSADAKPVAIEALKFQKLLLPEQHFEMTLRRAGHKLHFELRDDGDIFSSGRFVFEQVFEQELQPK